MLIDLQHAVGNFLHDIFVVQFDWWVVLGFVAQASDATIRVGAELADARWFSVGDLVDGFADGSLTLPPRLSVSRELIAHWLREHGVDLDAIERAHAAPA